MTNLRSIVQHAMQKQKEAPLNQRLVDIYSGNLHGYVDQSLSQELSGTSYQISRQRIASINLIERITNKLSKVYSDVPNRQTNDTTDQEIVNFYTENANVQDTMAQAETLLNLNKNFAVEPYISSGLIKLRVLAPHEFCVYSDNSQNPKEPTAFVKFMGSQPKGDKRLVNIYWVYTPELFTIVDSDFEVLEQQPNPYGVLPFVYCSNDKFSLQPSPDIDSFQNAILVPKLLTDLNYSVAFMSRSIIYGVDIDASNLVNAPDVLWSIKSQEGENKKPEIGTIEPKVDIPNVLSLITFTVSEWLTSKGIKPGSIGSLTPDNAASGVSKMVDEADTSFVVNKNRNLLTTAEKQLWQLLATVHNTLVPADILVIKKGLTDNLKVSVAFPIQLPIKDPAEKRNELKFQLDNKLISYTRALKQAHPDLSDEQIEQLKLEIENETKPITGV